MRGAALAARDWSSLLMVSVGADAAEGLPPVEGRYAVTNRSVTFTPLFPFDPGRAYRVTFNPARLPQPRTLPPLTSVVRLAALAAGPPTSVTAVYPSSEVLPANTLRLYVEFSAPMGRAAGRDFVHLLDEGGREVPAPFLPVEADFWNADHTRYTLFFDPGRVKQGILPNRQMGRPLEPGRHYTLEVSAEWRDAREQPLASAYRRSFRAGPVEAQPLVPSRWTITPPAARTRDPLIVTFPAPLDHGLLARALGIESAAGRAVEGAIRLEGADTRWIFTPSVPWVPGEYQIAALPILEDPAGNRIGQAFEVDTTKSIESDPADTYRTRFAVAERGLQ